MYKTKDQKIKKKGYVSMNKNLNGFMPQTKKGKVVLGSVMVLTLVLCALTLPVFADQASTLVGTLIDIVCKIFMYIGILLSVWSVGMLVLAFKNEDADSKSRAMMLLVVSCVLIGIKALVDGLHLKELIPSLS